MLKQLLLQVNLSYLKCSFFNFKISNLIIWGRLYIDTVKEFITISCLDKKSLVEIETNFSEYINKFGSADRFERAKKLHK